MEMANFCLFAVNRNRKQKFVFLGWQMINSNQRLLFQQTCPSMLLTSYYLPLRDTFWLPTGEHSMALFMKTDPNLNLEKEEILGFHPLQNVDIEAKLRHERMVKNRALHLSALVQSPQRKWTQSELQKACTEEKSSHWCFTISLQKVLEDSKRNRLKKLTKM
jgi:hypothetical protein